MKSCEASYNGKNYVVGLIPRGESGRKVQYGPLIPGPWAFAHRAHTVISAQPVRRPERVALADGETVLLWGERFTVTSDTDGLALVYAGPLTDGNAGGVS